MGVTDPAANDEVIQVVEDRRGVYRRLVVRSDRLVGATLVGDAAAASGLAGWFDRGDPLPPNRLDLLASGDPPESLPGSSPMIWRYVAALASACALAVLSCATADDRLASAWATSVRVPSPTSKRDRAARTCSANSDSATEDRTTKPFGPQAVQ